MARVISFANQKGGVGKSTLCIQQAFYLADLGKRVLVVDMDGQGNTSSRLAPQDVLDGKEMPGTKTADLFANEVAGVEVIHCPYGTDLIYTPKNDPELFEKEAVPLDEAANPARHLAPVIAQYDYVLVDCPPSLGRKLVAALLMSTHVVCPVKLSGFAVDGVEGLINTIIGTRKAYRLNLNILGIVINDMDRSINHHRAYKQLESAVPGFIFKHRIRHRPPLDAATSDGLPVWKLPYGHVASREVRAVLKEIIEKVG